MQRLRFITTHEDCGWTESGSTHGTLLLQPIISFSAVDLHGDNKTDTKIISTNHPWFLWIISDEKQSFLSSNISLTPDNNDQWWEKGTDQQHPT